ncbi:MAG: acetate/propionate family kinase [bacterium]|nr:acetate/propionate family kinase [bacterium]
MSRDCLLVVNAGSATLKVKIFKFSDLSLQVAAQVERIGLSGSTLEVHETSSGRMIRRNFPGGIAQHQQALREICSHFNHWGERLRAAAHRIVHGGRTFRKPAPLTKETLTQLHALSALAPLHNPVNLAVAEEAARLFPGVPQIGVFDTAYFADLPEEAAMYALPYEYAEKYGIRRYGFHGISHQFLAEAAAKDLGKPLERLRLVTAHLGSGCSLAAVKNGAPVDTTMGFSPLEGLTMGTRSGDVDPTVVTYLQKVQRLSPEVVETILNRQSGILGLFGYSSDLRDVLCAVGHPVAGYQPPKPFTAQDRSRAKLALDVFVYDIIRYVGAFATVMGGMDALVFSGAIGERSAVVRSMVKERLKLLMPFAALTIPTDEEWQIAKLSQSLARRLPSPVAAVPAAEQPAASA